ncbi:hypothetical protein SEA_DONNY_36 [Mycobacterium phage Donny]|uniref:DUF7172 domain-containing protein n=3 Tax=Acadianvirus acadian TaxID=1982901 RepID=A0A7M1CNT1_9CAUD|nr:hypothetical protein CM14_gp36 [Mycobacterium phage Acadian]AER48950.1 hypothetical protein ACADIAN_36 [Mycobacterium phage Acadian]QBI96491.1 hypothetical protein SEA_DONNY_36 [Mycobacterium phage Donny]QOP65578.1 hypothetical protein SEA_SUIGENERIS_36 [Mycobacterium phage Suigeneris]WUT94806.1 hypothetical protein PRODRIGUEZ_36 [Mycobacterium phage PRodriguez]
MSLKLCTSEYMLSNVNGIGVRRGWLPRVLSEQFLESQKDGEIKLSPDPVTMIDGDVTWHNDDAGDQIVFVLVHRAPRTIIAQSPSTVVIHDAWTKRVGVAPSADYPSVAQDTFGGRLQIDRAEVAPDDIKFGRYFLDGDDSQTWVPVGLVPQGQGFHFRYIASVQTPGTWVSPGTNSDVTPRWEAYARWTRLVALGWPVGSL